MLPKILNIISAVKIRVIVGRVFACKRKVPETWAVVMTLINDCMYPNTLQLSCLHCFFRSLLMAEWWAWRNGNALCWCWWWLSSSDFFFVKKKKTTNHEELLLAESQGLGGQTVASFWPGEDVVLLPWMETMGDALCSSMLCGQKELNIHSFSKARLHFTFSCCRKLLCFHGFTGFLKPSFCSNCV